MRNILFNRHSSKLGLLGSLIAVVVVAMVLSLVPQKTNTKTLAENCPNAPTTPTLNYWPVTYDDENTPFCHDYQAIDAAVYNPNGDTVYSQSESDWENGLNLNVGQTGVALMYIHNGAANNLPAEQTTAKNVKIETRTETSVGSSHDISVKFYGDNTNTVNKTFTVHTPSNAKLEVVPNSGFMYDYEGNLVLDQQNLNLGNSTYTLGDLDACFEYSIFLTFRFKVVGDTNEDSDLEITKEVRNVSDDTDFESSVTAQDGDKLEYRVKVRNTGNEVAENVTVTDNGVNGIDIDSNSVDIDINDNLWSGTFPGTINIGDLDEDDEVTITYEATVETDDCETLTNTVRANAENASQVSDSASVRVTDCDGGGGDDKDLEIRKQVKNLDDNGSFKDTVDARTGDDVRFRITVTNNGEGTVSNVIMTDLLPSGFRFADNVDVDGDHGDVDFNNRTLRVELESIREDDSKTVEFTAEVIEDDRTTICNEARATGNDVDRVEDEACVRITTTTKPGEANIVISKKAYNDTKGVDATSTHADRGNYITFTLTTTNTGDEDARNYVIRDDLSGVLPLATLIDSNGGTVNGNILTYPAMTIKPGQTVTKTIKVQVKSSLAPTLSYQIKNTYGNTVTVNIPGKVVFEAPKTGSAATSAGVFAGLVTATFVAVRRGKDILNFIFA